MISSQSVMSLSCLRQIYPRCHGNVSISTVILATVAWLMCAQHKMRPIWLNCQHNYTTKRLLNCLPYTQYKDNPKAFWKYINSKRKTKVGIGDLNSVDKYGKSVTVSTNIEKAEVLDKFFSSVFTVEGEFCCAATTCRPCHSPIEQLIFSEHYYFRQIKQIKDYSISRTRWHSSTYTI